MIPWYLRIQELNDMNWDFFLRQIFQEGFDPADSFKTIG